MNLVSSTLPVKFINPQRATTLQGSYCFSQLEKSEPKAKNQDPGEKVVFKIFITVISQLLHAPATKTVTIYSAELSQLSWFLL